MTGAFLAARFLQKKKKLQCSGISLNQIKIIFKFYFDCSWGAIHWAAASDRAKIVHELAKVSVCVVGFLRIGGV